MIEKKESPKNKMILRQRLIIIISVIFVLPSLVLCYIFYEQLVSLSLYHFVLFFLILTLVFLGIILIHYVFNAISNIAEAFKKAAEGGDNLSLNLQYKATELNEITYRFKSLIERLESITGELNQARDIFHESEETYRNIFNNIEESYYEVDLKGNFTFFNIPVSKILGYSREELKGMNYHQYTAKEDVEKVFLAYNEVYKTCIHKKDLEVKLLRKDGSKVFAEVSVSLIKNSSGQPIGFRGIIHDITDRKRMEEEVFALAITDQLTGLYNRRGFTALAEQQLRIAERTRNGILFLFADVDDLKQINDKLGHRVGDEVIVEVANILKEVFRKMDIIARIGGDEYAVLTMETSSEYSDLIIHRLQNQIDIHNAAENRDYKISLSFGLIYNDPGTTCSIDDLMSRADILMYKQKRNKRA